MNALEILRSKYAVHNLTSDVFAALAQAIAFYSTCNSDVRTAELVAEEFSEYLAAA
jgi:hypothetical protein